MNKKIIILSIFVILINFTVNIYGESKSFIWEIKKENIKTSYLVGSVHMLDKSVYPLNKAYDISFENSDSLMVEANVSAEKSGQLAMLALKLGSYKGDKTLKDSISKKTYDLAEKKLKKLGMDISGLNKFKPWMVAMTIVSVEMMKRGFDPELGLDKYFLKKANLKSKEIIELEGAKFQLDLFNSFSEEEHELFLFNVITDDSNSEIEFKKLLNAWKNGDNETLNTLVTLNIKKYPELKNLYYKLIDERNFGMVKKIEDFLSVGNKSYFVVVGAAHLVGENGLINLLKKKGYTLKQL